MKVQIALLLLAFIGNFTQLRCHNILFYMPCLGGHFGTMSGLLGPICERNNCTVIETSKLCERKLDPFRAKVKFQSIKSHKIEDDVSIHGILDFLLRYCSVHRTLNEQTFEDLSTVLQQRRGEFDLVVTDWLFTGALIAAENENVPMIVQSAGVPAGVENFQDKCEFPLTQAFVLKLFYGHCYDWLDQKRAKHNLPELDFQDNFLTTEYSSRFPIFQPTSPIFYPEPHHSLDYHYIGGFRNEDHHPKLSSEVEEWISSESTDVIYVSLGTHTILDEATLTEFVQRAKAQNQYRVIWSLGHGLQEVVNKLGLSSDMKIRFSGYLPQYTLLGHPKVTIFVTHCGLGSIVDLVKRNVPSILVPQFADQFLNANQLRTLSAGIWLDRFGFDDINNAIQKINQNYEYFKNNINIINEDFTKHENIDELNKFVAKIAERKKVSVQYSLSFRLNSPRVATIWNFCKVSACALAVGTVLILIKFVMKLCSKLRSKSKPD